MNICIVKPKIKLMCVALTSVALQICAMEPDVREIVETVKKALVTNDTACVARIVREVAASPPFQFAEDQEILGSTLRQLLKELLLADKCDMARVLIENKANPNHFVRKGSTLLMEIAQHGSTQAVDVLLQAGADPTFFNQQGGTALFSGFLNNEHCIGITQLFMKKIGVNCVIPSTQKTALHVAACLPKRTTLTALLLEHHADTNARDQEKDTPLEAMFKRSAALASSDLYKTALLLHVYGQADITQEQFDPFFSPTQIALILHERARRQADVVCINEFCSHEQQQAQTFKESYKSALNQLVLRSLPTLPAALTAIIAEYACYDPVIDFELCNDPEEKEDGEEKEDESPVIKKSGKALKIKKKRCVIQ